MSPLFSRTAAALALSLTLGQAAVPQKIESGGAYTSPEILATVGNTIYFTATDVSRGRELWRTDGTQAGTVFVKDIHAGASNSGISQPMVVGNVLYFTADDGLHGSELWRTDGTTNGTVLVKDIFPGTGGTLEKITVVGSTLYFLADDGVHGKELWKSDGTESGTVLVKDIYPGVTSGVTPGGPVRILSSNGRPILTPNGSLQVDYTTVGMGGLTQTGGGSLTLSPSTSYLGSTGVLDYTAVTSPGLDATKYNLSPTIVGGNGVSLTSSNGSLVDVVSSPKTPAQGDTAATNADDTTPQAKPTKTEEVEVVPMGSSMSVVSSGNSGGTSATTISGLGTLTLSSTNSTGPILTLFVSPKPEMVAVGNILYFAASDVGGNLALWKSDGTESGTVKVKSISETAGNTGYPSFMKSLGDKLCFFSYDESNGGALWVSDGKESGTRIIHAFQGLASSLINVGTNIPNPNRPYYRYLESPSILAGDYLYFYGSDGVQTGLWCTDGTVEGTECANPHAPEIRDMVLFKDTIYISTPENQLWTSDGTEEGTFLVEAFAASPIQSPYLLKSAPQFMESFGNKLYFTMSSGDYGYELWSTNGENGGSRVVKDVYPGINSGLSGGVFSGGNAMYFVSSDTSGKFAIWKTAPDAMNEAAAPVVTTQAAAGLSYTGAQFKGTVNPKGSAVTAWFEYQENYSLGFNKTTPIQSVKASTKTTSLSVPLKGLWAGSSYGYRLVVQNKDRIIYGDTLWFTLPSPPSLNYLALSSGSILFSPSVFSYSATVPATQATISLTPTAYSDRVTISVNGSGTGSGAASKPVKLKVGKNKITVVVTSKDVKASVSYTVTVTRLK